MNETYKYYSRRYLHCCYHKSTYGQSSLRRNTNTKRREVGRPNFSPNYSQQQFRRCLKTAQLEEKEINIGGEKLSNLRFADDLALTTEDVRDMEHQLITVNEESLKIGLKIHKGKTKFMRNIDTTDNIQINGTEIEKVTNYKYLGQTIAMEKSTKQEVSTRIKAGLGVFGKYREISLDRHFPMSLKR